MGGRAREERSGRGPQQETKHRYGQCGRLLLEIHTSQALGAHTTPTHSTVVHTISHTSMCVSDEYRFSLTLPESTTHTTSSMVMDVSAMLVAMTILRTPSGGRLNTRA